MLGLRHLLQQQLKFQPAQMVLEQAWAAASLPALSQPWSSQLQQTCSMATARKAPKLPSKHERRVANYEFCKKRAAWRREVKALRMQWLQQYKDRLAAHNERAEAAKQQMQQLQRLRDAGKQVDKTKHEYERKIRDAERAVFVAGMRYAAAMREDFRQKTIQKFKEQRRAELLEQSRSWIPQDQLEARIAAALENPAHL